MRDRYFYSKRNQKAIEECMASKSLVTIWYKEFKSFDKIIPGKTYAQALLSENKTNHTQFQSQLYKKVNGTPKISSRTVQKKNRTLQIPQQKVACPHVTNVHRNNTRVTQCSVAGDKTINQRQQDPLVISNRFQMVQFLVDEQEQDQQTPHVSFGSVSLPIGTKNVQKQKCRKNISPHVSRAKVGDKDELILAQQEKIPLVGNKNENGTFDVGCQSIINQNSQDWSLAHTNTHESYWESMLTGNYNLNSTGQENQSNVFLCQSQELSNPICQHNEQCIMQTGGQFGFVPQTDLKLYDGEVVHWDIIPDIIQSHYIVKSSGLPKFLKSRIPVNTNLNIKNWRLYLNNYWDQQLPDLLEYGFPLDFDRNCQLQSVDLNHKSADIHLDQVKIIFRKKCPIRPLLDHFNSFHCHFTYLHL